jgi:hypothetical protein
MGRKTMKQEMAEIASDFDFDNESFDDDNEDKEHAPKEYYIKFAIEHAELINLK